MKFKLIFLMVITGVFLVCFNLSAAEDTGTDDGTQTNTVEEEPAFKNAAEAQRAMNLAEAYAAKPDPELQDALDEVSQAQKELDAAIEAGDEARIEEAEKALEAAQKNADDKMAEDTDLTPEDIAQMRDDGLGWGEIAHELGLHPSVLGLGHTNRNKNKKGDLGEGSWGDGTDDQDFKAATRRNFKSGFSQGHGASADKGNQGNSSDNDNKNNSKGKSNAGGNGKGGGNGGGNGKGGGKK